MSQIGPKYVSWNLLKHGSLLPKSMQTLLWKETKQNSNHPSSAFLTPTQEKNVLLKLEMCYLQVRSWCLSQIRIIRISQQTFSWANPTSKVPFRVLVVWLRFNFVWMIVCLEFDCFFALVSSLINFHERTFLMSFLL